MNSPGELKRYAAGHITTRSKLSLMMKLRGGLTSDCLAKTAETRTHPLPFATGPPIMGACREGYRVTVAAPATRLDGQFAGLSRPRCCWDFDS